MTQQPTQAPLVAEALQWVDQTLEAWIADCEADPSGFAVWAAQRFRSCRTQIVGLARQLEQAEREKARLVETLELAKPWIGVTADHRGRWCPPEVKQEVKEALSEQNTKPSGEVGEEA